MSFASILFQERTVSCFRIIQEVWWHFLSISRVVLDNSTFRDMKLNLKYVLIEICLVTYLRACELCCSAVHSRACLRCVFTTAVQHFLDLVSQGY